MLIRSHATACDNGTRRLYRMSVKSYFGIGMASLASQIMNCFDEGRELDRAELRFDAADDSVGRVLRKLVADKKLVRVSRGRYRKADSKKAAPAKTIADAVMAKVRRSKRNVFLRKDFENLGSYDAVGRALRRAEEAGVVVQIGYGLYAKAEPSTFTGRPAPTVGIKRLASEALSRLGKKTAASSFDDAYNRGRSTQVPTGRAIQVKDRVRRKIGYDGKYVIFERAR